MTCSLQVGDWTHAGGYGFALHHKLGVVVCKGDLNYIYFAMEIDTNIVLTIYSKRVAPTESMPGLTKPTSLLQHHSGF